VTCAATAKCSLSCGADAAAMTCNDGRRVCGAC
jgi:hypothetical protein